MKFFLRNNSQDVAKNEYNKQDRWINSAIKVGNLIKDYVQKRAIEIEERNNNRTKSILHHTTPSTTTQHWKNDFREWIIKLTAHFDGTIK